MSGPAEDLPAPLRPLEQIETEIVELAAHIAAATCRWLLLLAEFDRRDGWSGWNVLSCAHWLNWKCGLSRKTAAEYLRVGRALERLPRITEAFAAGRLSYSKVRALTRVADADTEEVLLSIALSSTVAQTEKVVSGYRRAEHNVHGDCAHEEYVSWEYDEHGCLVGRFRVSPEHGGRVLIALDAAKAAVLAVA
jgi:hypothetical protein